MAALQSIRSKSGLLIGILGVALFAFIVSGFFSSSNTYFNQSKDNAFSVNGDVVSTGEYQNRILEWEEFEKMNYNIQSIDAQSSLQIREMVYAQIVKERMLDDQADKLGLTVTTDEINEIVNGYDVAELLQRMQVYMFTDRQTGQFNQEQFFSFVEFAKTDTETIPAQQKGYHAQMKMVWSHLYNRIKYQRLEEKYASLVGATALVTDLEATAMADESKNSADILYVVSKYDAISDSTLKASDEDLKKLYDLRKNNFKLDGPRSKISYFVKDVVPSEEDYAAVDKQMQEAYTKLSTTDNPASVVLEYSANPYTDAFIPVSILPEQLKEFAQSGSIGQIDGPSRQGQNFVMNKIIDRSVGPDSVFLQAIILPPSLNAQASNVIIDSIHNVIKAGKAFADVANELNPQSNGGEIGMTSELDLTGAGIAKECFAAAPGSVLKLTMNGRPQLFRIVSKNQPTSKVKLASVVIPVLVSEKTRNKIENELNQFIAESGKVENFDKAAREKGYGVMSDILIQPAQPTLEKIENSRSVIHWAFNQKVGDVNKFDLTDKQVVAIVKSQITDAYMPMSELKEGLTAEVIRDKKAEKIITDLKSKNLTTLDAYAQTIGSNVDTLKFVTFQTNSLRNDIGYEPVLNAVAQVAQLNKVSAPLKGGQGVYVTTVIDRRVNPTDSNIEQTKMFMRQYNAQMLAGQSMEALMKKMEVKDNRVKFW